MVVTWWIVAVCAVNLIEKVSAQGSDLIFHLLYDCMDLWNKNKLQYK